MIALRTGGAPAFKGEGQTGWAMAEADRIRFRLDVEISVFLALGLCFSVSTVALVTVSFFAYVKNVNDRNGSLLAVPERGVDESRCHRFQLPTRRVGLAPRIIGQTSQCQDKPNLIWLAAMSLPSPLVSSVSSVSSVSTRISYARGGIPLLNIGGMHQLPACTSRLLVYL